MNPGFKNPLSGGLKKRIKQCYLQLDADAHVADPVERDRKDEFVDALKTLASYMTDSKDKFIDALKTVERLDKWDDPNSKTCHIAQVLTGMFEVQEALKKYKNDGPDLLAR